jgi:mRNA-degrading endonuclease YafQ of YafQ-DinJ toxin-antitoxin module
MSQVTLKQMPAFKRAYKKLHKQEKAAVNEAIKIIIKDPTAGSQKRGDLAGVFVYKFKIKKQEWLLAYEYFPKERLLLALGAHENFYRDLKRH